MKRLWLHVCGFCSLVTLIVRIAVFLAFISTAVILAVVPLIIGLLAVLVFPAAGASFMRAMTTWKNEKMERHERGRASVSSAN
jgi:hypothetical protein